MNPLSPINPVTSDQAERLVSEDAYADLAGQITSAAVPEPGAAGAHRVRRRTPRPGRRRWLIRVPVAAGLATTALVAAGILQLGPAGTPPAAQALSFSTHDGWIEVTVRDADAAPSAYRKEFRAHGLNVQLAMVPASPSAVGERAEAGFSVPWTDITCTAAAPCPMRLRIPVGYHGSAKMVFGRPARPGERYLFKGRVTAPGEAMHGLRYQGRTVAAVLAMLQPRHVTVARFTLVTGRHQSRVPAGQVPGDWFVYAAEPWAADQVRLFTGPARHVPPFSYGTQFSSIWAALGPAEPMTHN